jgi:hypothetical protein
MGGSRVESREGRGTDARTGRCERLTPRITGYEVTRNWLLIRVHDVVQV